MAGKKEVHCCGYVQFDGRFEKLWAKGHISKPQHEAEITEYLLGLYVDEIYRGPEVDRFDTDFILEVNGNRYYGEHDRDTMNTRQMKAKFRKLSACPFDVLWVVPSETRLRELAKMAPNEKHWFTTAKNITDDPHGEIWVNRFGEISSLEHTRE